MRIVHCISSLSGGGAERQLQYLAPSLAAKGFETHIVFLSEGPSPPDEDLFADIRMHRINCKNNYDPMIIWHLHSLFRGIKPDVVQTWIPQIDILAGIALLSLKLPWLIREANVSTNHQGWKGNLRKIVARHANQVVANSQGGKAYWQKIHPEIPCALIHNGLPEKLFLPVFKISNRFTPKSSIIYAGRLVDQKNIFLLLEAVNSLAKEMNLKLLVCGTGELLDSAKSFVVNKGLESYVDFLGHINQTALHQLFQNGSLLTNPSFREGCPNVVLEAMANGCPVAVSAIPSHLEILDHDSAYFFPPNDHAALKKAIKSALSDPYVARQKALNARQIAEKFKIDKMVDAYIDIYERILFQKQ